MGLGSNMQRSLLSGWHISGWRSIVEMQDSAFGSSHGAFLQKPGRDGASNPVPARGKTCIFSQDFGPRDVAREIAYDVDQLHDDLPQPYRMLNGLLNDLVATSTEMTFVDAGDSSLATGQLEWRVQDGSRPRTASPPLLRPSAALHVGQLVAWCAVEGTPFRIAVEQSGALVACVTREPAAVALSAVVS